MKIDVCWQWSSDFSQLFGRHTAQSYRMCATLILSMRACKFAWKLQDCNFVCIKPYNVTKYCYVWNINIATVCM